MKSSLPEAGRPSTTAVPQDATVAMPTETPPPAGVSNNQAKKLDHSGHRLGDFKLLRRLGEGGMGQVYLAEQLSLQRRVAIKVLRSDFAENETFLKRFEAEAKAIAQLTHPNIVQVYAVGTEQNTRYMALEYVEGTNLKDYLSKKGPPDLAIALVIMRQIASALLKAAELGIIHRDIKPENILLTRKVEVKVADFGLSRMVGDDVHLTQTGTTMGTPLYMSPEQIMGKAVDPRTDLYSFGATCYHLLTGTPPFLADSAMAVGVRHLTDPAKPLQEIRPDLPAELCNLVHRLLAKKPEDRPQSAREVLREIRKIQETLAGSQTQALDKAGLDNADGADPFDFGATLTQASPTPGTGSTLSVPHPPSTMRRWLLPLVGGSVMVAVVGGAIFGLLLRHEGQTHAKSSATSTRTETKKLVNNLSQERERNLKKRVEETKYPREQDKVFDFPAEKMIQGVRARTELIMFYVDNLDDCLDQAKAFTDAEANAKQGPDIYRCIGWVGKAVILTSEGKHKESYEALENAFAMKPNNTLRRGMLSQLNRNKDLASLILMALRTNEKSIPIPPNLVPLKEEAERADKAASGDKLRPPK
ncbi:MAG: serine/threonine-protein kinase [Gemmatales bacterium]